MRSMAFGLAALTIAAAGAVTAARAQEDSCFKLWVARNTIFKANGYCFKTARAIRYFGNAGCRYDVEAEVPLSSYDRALIAGIQAREEALGCR